MKTHVLTASSEAPTNIGGKAGRVHWLIRHGYRVPETWVVPAAQAPPQPAEVEQWLPDRGPWAVRSSAAVEDGFGSSYAGQFATELNVLGPGDVAEAIRRVRLSAVGSTVTAYRRRTGDATPIAMSVMVQRMVTPRVSGVAFSRNPMTGLNEIVIEAVAGRGDALVDEGVTPQRWIGRWGGWSLQPENEPVLPDGVARSIVEETAQVAEQFGSPVDLEWVWDGTAVWWVQLRPITGLEDVAVYSNRISREVMPGMIKPLVWSINVPVVNRAWIDLFGEVIGPNDLRPEQLAKAFAYRSYFNMAAIGEIFERLGMPRDALEVLLGLPSETKPAFRPTLSTVRHLPRLLATATRKARYGKRVDGEVGELWNQFKDFERVDLSTLSDTGLLARIDDLADLATRAAYQNIVIPLLANLYVTLLRGAITKGGIDVDGLDLELSDPANPFNPNPALDRLGATLVEVGPEVVKNFDRTGRPGLPDEVRREFEDFLDRFGHLSDSGNDFSIPPWSERPEAVLRLALDHTETKGAHQARPWREATGQLNSVSRRIVRSLHGRASQFVDHREAISFVYTYGYGLFRPLLIEAGRRLAARGLMEKAEDVMYLHLHEVQAVLLGDDTAGPAGLVSSRRAEMAELEDVDMPEIIFGDDFVPARLGTNPAERLEGVATSRGRHRGTLRIVKGIDDSAKVQPGDVIAIPFSDVGWTPLFARAGAVIAEAGGMLSHSSIVAREYRIPCVVSVTGATRLPDGATVVVDGYTGTVIVEDG
jgi:phosphohistidine swiveling domain-containing protein